MKHWFIFISLVSVSLLATACLPDVEYMAPPQEHLLTATISAESGTKTSLSKEENGVSKVLWSENDLIDVFVDGGSNSNVYHLVSGAGTRQAVFSGYGTGADYIAVYPSGLATNLADETMSVSFPVEQTYKQGSFADGACPMVAVSNSSALSFRMLCSVLKLSMTGSHNVTRLVFRSNDKNVKVSGPASVSLADPDHPVVTVLKTGCDSLVMNTAGVVLDRDTPTDFYFLLPAQTYKGGFTVRVYTATGYMDKKLNTDFTMVRARKHDAATFAVKLDVGIDPSAALSGSGTEDDPFQIGSLEDLLLMQSAVNTRSFIKGLNGSEASAIQACYLLTSDIDLSPLCSEKSGKSWTPIADDGSRTDDDEDELAFAGVFDGGGHRITHLFSNDYLKYRGFFGYVARTGKICNLTVDGHLENVGYNSGLIAGRGYGTLENCTSQGQVDGSSSIGGTTGYWSGPVRYCTNKADVTSTSWVGGISSYIYYAYNCINEGTIVSTRDLCGGIAGYQNADEMVNCCNYGEVRGFRFVGGIVGYARQWAKVYNCVNAGVVIGSGENVHVGGICGFLSSSYAYENNNTEMSNCINVGKVSFADGSMGGWIGSLAGFNGYDTDFQGDGNNTDFVKIYQSYWLYDAGKQTGMEVGIGGGTGKAENNTSLAEAQLKDGVPYDGVLYKSSDGTTYSVLLDALNACAFDLKNKSSLPLTGWILKPGDTCPVPGDLDVTKPGSGQSIFTVSPNEFSFMTAGGQFTVEVTSSLDYTVGQLPEWITQESVQEQVNRPHTHVHSFRVAANSTGQERKAEIQFANTEGKVHKVKVGQKAPYLTVSSTELFFADTRGSKRIAISSSIDWVVTAQSGSDWFSLSPTRGFGDGAVSVVVSENLSPTARSGSFVIAAADGATAYTVTVVQSGNKGEDVGNWQELPFYHQSVAMRFTATWCGWCPYMSNAITRAQELWPDKIQHLALHGSDSDLPFNPTGTLMRLYGINGFPTGVMDGRIRIENNDPYNTDAKAAIFINAAKETEETYGTASGLAIRSTSAGQRVDIDIDAYFKVAGDYKITVLLLEDGIIHEQASGGSNYVHNSVARATATDILGDPFTVSTDLSQKSFSYSVVVPDYKIKCKIENMRVLAYIQKSFGSAPKIQTSDYGDYYIDNCATAAVGEVLKVALVGGSSGGGGGNGQGNEGITPGGEIK